jgi:thioredoxin-related protein
MQKLILLFLSISLISFYSSTTPAPRADHVNWMSLSDASARMQKEKRPILIDLYTDWCGWCKVMDRKTYSNKNVTQYIQDKFYPVKLNAETRDSIQWNGRQYHFSSDYRSNEFAVYLTRGRLEFPTTVVIPLDGSEPQAIPGYLEPKDFELIAKYFGEGGYGRIPFAEFQKTFKASW